MVFLLDRTDSGSRQWLVYAIGFAVVVCAVAAVKLSASKHRRPALAAPANPLRPTSTPAQTTVGATTSVPSNIAPPGSTTTTGQGVGSREEVRIEWLATQYRSFVAELQGEVTAYRNQRPVFAKFHRVLEEQVMPAAQDAGIAWLQLEEVRKKAPDLYEAAKANYKKNEKQAQQAIDATVSDAYRDIAGEAFDLYRSRELQLSDREKGRFLECVGQIAKHSNRRTGDTAPQSPFAEGSVEAMLFRHKLGRSALDYTGGLSTFLRKLPPELEAKQGLVDKMYGQLSRAMPEENGDTPEKYVDEYRSFTSRLVDELRNVQRTYRKLAKSDSNGEGK